MSVRSIDDVERLKRINQALMNRVESAMDSHGNAFSLFQTAISLEDQVRRRTEELAQALRNVEHINADLAAAKQAADEANLAKTRFLASASHDVMQPLNAALLSVSVLADLQTQERGRDLVTHIERTLDTMSQLLSTLLDISRFDAGVIKPRMEAVPLSPIFESLCADFLPVAQRNGLKLIFRPSTLAIHGDKTMVRRILQNLVANALSYTRTGGVFVGARRRGNRIHVEIYDTGIGISPQMHNRIFEEFNRGDAARETGLQELGAGLGLGLSIVQRMINALGYELSLRSNLGRGSRFRISMPRGDGISFHETLPVDRDTNKRGNSNFFGKNLLLIENDANVAKAMIELVSSWGFNVKLAKTKQQAIDIITSSTFRPDFIIADQHLDQGDLGTHTVEAVRHHFNTMIPAILATADPSPTLDQETQALDMELMIKPVKPAQLRALLSHLMIASN